MTNLHYRLTNNEWLALVAHLKLNFAEVKVLLHLRTIDPFGDKFKDADTKDIAKSLDIHQRTVQKTLCTLAAKELIDLEIGKFKFRLRSQLAASTPPDDPQAAIQDIELAASTPPNDLQTANENAKLAASTPRDDLQAASGGVQAAEAAYRPLERRTGRDRSLEPSQSKDSRTPQTNKTLLDSSNSSLEERERNARSQKKPVENSSGASDCADKPDPLTDGSIQKTKSAPALAPNEFDERVWADAKNLDPEERQAFWLWLKAKVNKMPNPPANPAQVARSFIRMDGDELLQQFRDETNAARLMAIPSQPIIPNPDTDHRLFRLQSEWRLADKLAQKTIATEIASKPEWGIAIGPHGPEKILVPLAKTDHGDLIGKMEAQLVKLQMTKRQAIAYMVEARLWDKTCDPGTLTDDQLQQLTDALAKFPKQTIANNLGANP